MLGDYSCLPVSVQLAGYRNRCDYYPYVDAICTYLPAFDGHECKSIVTGGR